MNFITRSNTVARSIVRYLKTLGTKRPWVAGISAAVIVALILYALFAPRSDVGDAPTDSESVRTVELIPVSGASQGATLTPGSEVVLRAETSGKIVRVLPVGTRVSSGAVVAEFEKAAQQASLLQAEGALEAAQASLEKTRGGIRSERLAVLQTAYDSARSGAVTTLLSAYGAVDSAVRDTADQMLSNPESSRPQLNFASSNSQRRIDIEGRRVSLGSVLDRQANSSATISSDDNLAEELSRTETEVRDARAFIDQLIAALNEAIPTGASGTATEAEIAAFKTAATAARTALTGALSSLTTARSSLETSRQNLDEGLTGAEAVDLAAGEAQVKQAQGAYDTALAAYQKTIVRSSAPGTVVSCNAALGDVLTVGADVCRVQTVSGGSAESVFLPLSSVKYTPVGSFVFLVTADGVLEAVPVTTGLVTADGITVRGLLGNEYVVRDVRGLTPGESVIVK